MATKPVSNTLSDAKLFAFRVFLFLVLGNKVSMFFLNLFFPRWTVKFASNDHIFGSVFYEKFERRALKWPFHWAKWWMKPEKMGLYPLEYQIKYFFDVAFENRTEVETLKGMKKVTANGTEFIWPKAYEKLFFNYGRRLLPIEDERYIPGRNNSNPKWNMRTSVAEFMTLHTRLIYEALNVVIDRASVDMSMEAALRYYLSTGALSNDQLKLLVKSVHSQESLMRILVDYVERYSLSEENIKLLSKTSPNDFVTKIIYTKSYWEQQRVLKAFTDNDEGRATWRKFCKETQLLPEVQMDMSIQQYHIFHNVGKTLDPKTILFFLSSSTFKSYWEEIFKKEPDHGLITDEIIKCVNDNPALKALLDKACE